MKTLVVEPFLGGYRAFVVGWERIYSFAPTESGALFGYLQSYAELAGLKLEVRSEPAESTIPVAS